MKRSTCRAFWKSSAKPAILAAFVLAMSQGVPARESAAEEPSTWAEAMLAGRAACRAAPPASAAGRAAEPFDSGPVADDGPGVQVSVDVSGWSWMRLATELREGGGNCHIWGDARLVANDGSTVWLGDLTPVYVNVGWGELLVDKNWQDNPLRIGDRRFERGLWVHSNSMVAYQLDGKYERFEAWAGMDAARAKGVAVFRVLPGDPEMARNVWQQISRAYPAHARWFTEDFGRDHLAWFGRADRVDLEKAAIGRVLAELGPRGELLQSQFDRLRQERVAADDPRWLDLYVRACRGREAWRGLSKVWVADLARLLQPRVEALLDASVPADDPRWDALHATIGRLAAGLSESPSVDVAALRQSATALSAALPGRFQGGPELLARVDGWQQRWPEQLSGMAAGDEAALEQLPALAEDTAALGRELLSGFRGMDEFLAAPAHAEIEKEWRRQFLALEHDLARREHFVGVAHQAFRPESLVLDTDRDPADIVLRRTAALLENLRSAGGGPELDALAAGLGELKSAAAAIDVADAQARYALYAEACRLRRRIAFSNPLLDFDDIVFIKRHRALFNHMCDQYYGIAATPGGGLYVLEGAFGPNPQVRDVLADSVVERGRLAGERLCGGPSTPPAVRYDGMGRRHGEDTGGGSFLSPHLSYDATHVLFAYVENRGDPEHRHHTDYPNRGYWHEGRCYHIFRVNVDGTGLEQLTDGTWNDFDPVLMPSGRIVFNSERRGGYLRCGRVCPTYTLFDMAPDGSDIRCLSFHETNEWHPSVAHDGMIMFTRWDYVDRHGVVAHHPWVMTPDGCDPRAVHGNFSVRSARADMQLDIRAIPGSHQYVATAAPHHGQAFGSLVVFDPRIPDDDAMAPVYRLTPESPFPESQGPTGAQTFGQAAPLSEDYYLVVYDVAMEVPAIEGPKGRYGLYLLDSFGNRELLYRDSEIASQNPLPLRPRPVPPIVPERSVRVPEHEPAEATVGVIDVYKGLLPWPEGTEIKALRVYQILPLSVASARVPHNTGIQIPQGSDSINLARSALGTVPVEADGSAYFTVPARRELYFQALDAEGLAVTSMRSATQFQPGEQSMCHGCHEPRHDTPPLLGAMPLAMRRAPSPLVPEADGTNPFSYPRLVQPVLDKHCVACHRDNADKAPPLDSSLAVYPERPTYMNRSTTYFRSYVSLAPEFGFYDYGGRSWSDPKWYRTTPGEFGARASKLYHLLREGHHDVKLSPAEMRRITVWLDSMSLFYGVYEQEGGEAQLRGEIARPTLE